MRILLRSTLVLTFLYLAFYGQSNASSHKEAFLLSDDIFKASELSFISHIDPSDVVGTYLTMEIPFAPVHSLCPIIEKRDGVKLIDRGEAHITVITPIEYNNALSQVLSMKEINRIARKMNIQQSKFKPRCLGSGRAQLEGKEERTYYIIVESEELQRLRSEINRVYLERGGDANLFDPKAYHPHITIGYTKRDLFISDGVIKDKKSCIGLIKLLTKSASFWPLR